MMTGRFSSTVDVSGTPALIRLNQRRGEVCPQPLNKRLLKQLVITKTINLRTIRNDSTTVDLDFGIPSDLGHSITQSGRVHGSTYAVLGGIGLCSSFDL